jgi:hypothetical protein
MVSSRDITHFQRDLEMQDENDVCSRLTLVRYSYDHISLLHVPNNPLNTREGISQELSSLR